MQRFLLIFLALATSAFAANLRLYLKDGDFQMVREYKVDGDRVRFYSVDRKDWEEIPLDLVDIKKTEKESTEKAASLAETIRIEQEEETAIKADRKQVQSVPDMPGVYVVDGTALTALTESEVEIEDSKSRKILQILAPAPIIAGKSTVTIKGKAAKFRITNTTPEFFFRLAQEERFVIIKLEPKKNDRVVEVVTILPNEEGTFEDQKQVAAFKKQFEPQLHKLWPEQPLEPGEYAVVEYTEGKVNVRVWDFAVDKKK
ncbi:MAG: hypothetical protein ABIR70_22430 [Bryobacteraceae bacterium]